MVTDGNPLYARCLMWACLVCVWACMRVSDLQGIDVSRLRLFREGLKGFLVKTKTTGPDKKVAEVPFFIGRNVVLSGHDWLRAGFDLWKGLGQLDWTFLVFQSSADFEEPCYKFARPEVISNYMRLVWRRLRTPFRRINERTWRVSHGWGSVPAGLQVLLVLDWSQHEACSSIHVGGLRGPEGAEGLLGSLAYWVAPELRLHSHVSSDCA